MFAFEVATVGDNCIDRFQSPINLSVVGGNAVNVAVHLRRLGLRSAYFGALGRDPDGARTLDALRVQNVAVDHVKICQGRTAYTEIEIDETGERIIGFEDFGVCRDYYPDEAEVRLLLSMRHVHFGWMVGSESLVRRLRDGGVSVSKDTTVNPGAQDLSIAFTSAHKEPLGAREIANGLLVEGAEIAVVTLGAQGSVATDGKHYVQTGIKPTEVVDTTGAGDTFIAGFIAGRLAGGALQQCLDAGRDAAADTCTYFGGFPQIPLAFSRS